MFLYEFAEKTAQKPDTVATYVRRNKKIFKNHVERRQKQIWLDEKAVDILLKKYPEVQKKQKKPLNKERFEEIITKSLKTLYENQEILAKEIDKTGKRARGKNRATAERNFCSAEREKVIFRIKKTLECTKITNDMSEIATNLENTRV